MTATTNNLKLTFANGNEALDVRHFSVHEEMNELFEVSILAISDDSDVDIAGIVGKGAIFKLLTPNHQAQAPVRVWSGVVSSMSQVHAEPAPGQSMYHLTIVPDMWRLTLRRNNRIYEHKDTPTIVRELLMEWKIDVVNKIKDKYPWHEYCVQYGESDYDFVCRLLEDAGITFYFHQDATQGKGGVITKLVLADKPTDKEFERGGSLAYAGHMVPRFGADQDFCASVTLTQRVKPGKFVLKDYNFRAPLFKSLVQTGSGKDAEDKYEQYDYVPGGFWWDTKQKHKPVADTEHGANNDEVGEGQKLAKRSMEAERRRRMLVSFHTNATDLAPGKIVGINQGSSSKDHPSAVLAPGNKILLIESHIEGEHNGEWLMTVNGVFSKTPYRPERKTPKPRIEGVQSAFVVGPAGQEIYTDEYGRVRVQFHWDREHAYDQTASCWVRVSQSWAGGKFGMMNIPRIGHEVLVGFFDGDPDRPVILGRVYNETSPVPWTLPDNATKSGWRSNSLPTSAHLGYNELSFEDAAGKESISIQAEKDLSYVVKSTETSNIGNSRSASIGTSDSLDVGKMLLVHVGESHVTGVGKQYSVSVGPNTGYLITDKSITASTSLASLTFKDGNISLDASDQIHIHAGKGIELSSSGGQITIQGGPEVRFNDAEAGAGPQVAKVPEADPPAAPGGGPVGTKPVIPSGATPFDKPGPLEDVDTDPKPPAAAPGAGPEAKDPIKPSDSTHTLKGPLFGPGGPKASDVRQGGMGDCYLMSSMQSVATHDPQAIRELVKDNGNGTYTVTFHDPPQDTSHFFGLWHSTDAGATHAVTVDGVVPDNAGIVHNGAIWPEVVEKAYAQEYGGGKGYEGIGNGGWPQDALSRLTGGAPASGSTSGAGEFQTMRDMQRNGTEMVAWTNAEQPPDKAIFASHAYSVQKVYTDPKTGTEMVNLFNPHNNATPAEQGRSAQGGGKGGAFTMTFADFQSNFPNLSSATKRP